MNNGEWKKQLKTQKGDYAESLVKAHLIENGYHVYSIENDGPHQFDFMLYHPDDNKLRLCDVKAKARRESRDDTGIDKRFYDEYTEHSKTYNIDFTLIFVDEKAKQIYGNTITELDSHGNFIQDGYVYWELQHMIKLRNLTDEEVEELNKYNQRKPCYDGKIETIDKEKLAELYNHFKENKNASDRS